MAYLSWKLVHILAVILFIGSITTGFFWAAHAVRSNDFRAMANTFEGIIRADRLFSTPAVLTLVASGLLATWVGGYPIFGTGWILWGIILLVIAGAAFGMRVAPLQRELVRLARDAANDAAAQTAFRERYRSWQVWGSIATLAPLLAVVVMVLKPNLPAF